MAFLWFLIICLTVCATLCLENSRRGRTFDVSGKRDLSYQPEVDVSSDLVRLKRGNVDRASKALQNRHKSANVGTFDIPYCWRHDRNYDDEMKWVEQALNQSWNTLNVLKLINKGYCDKTSSGDPGNRTVITVFEWEGSDCNAEYTPQENSVSLTLVGFEKCTEIFPNCGKNEETRRLCIQTLAVHEFGHAIGLHHEQIRSDSPMTVRDRNEDCRKSHRAWDPDAENIGPWDENSVMNYCKKDYFDLTRHVQLSLGDKASVLSIYGLARYFNDGCTNNRNPNSAACRAAIHEFCRKVLNVSSMATGIARGVTKHGISVACFNGSFAMTELPQAANDRPVGKNATVVINSIEGGNICEGWAKEIRGMAENETFLSWHLKADEDSSSSTVLCKAATWRGILRLDNIGQFNDSAGGKFAAKCNFEMTTMIQDEGKGYPPECKTIVDEYCNSQQIGTTGVILSYEKEKHALDAACFEADLKFELLTEPTEHMLG